ncbi:hypothetical protein Tco_1062022, partial [Tanacetum coccineum]
MKRGFRGAPRPLLPAMLLVATTNPNAGQEHPDVAQSQPSSSTIPVPSTSLPPEQSPPPIPTPIPASTPTPIPETDPEPMEHTFEEPSPAHQHFSPPQEHAQGQMTLDDLLQVVPQLMTRVDSLEKDLKQTKLTMGSAIVKLVKKVKKLEGILKRKNVVFSDSEEEEPEDQGRKSQDDPLVSLVQGLVTPSKTTVNASGEEQVEDISPNTLEAAKTLSRVAFKSLILGVDGVNTAEGFNTGSIKVSTISGQVSTDSIKKSIPSPDKGQREGKAPMIIEEALRRTRNQNFYKEDTKDEANAELSRVVLGVTYKEKTFKEDAENIYDELLEESGDIEAVSAEEFNLKRFGEELQTKTSKRLKSDEVKDDESTKKTGKRRKQIARKGLHSDKTDEDEFEDSKDDDPISGTNIPINPVLVAIKPPCIATYKIIKQGEKGVYQIVKEDGTDIVYTNFGAMLKDITRDDLTELYRIVMNRYGVNRLEFELEKVMKSVPTRVSTDCADMAVTITSAASLSLNVEPSPNNDTTTQ